MADDNKQDLLARMIQHLQEIQPGFSEAVAVQLEQQMRTEFGGQKAHILKRPPVLKQVMTLFNGRNAGKVAGALKVHRSTVYRQLKKAEQQAA